MSLEAAAGKNPLSHVGKIYNVLARNICRALVAIPGISAAHCLMVSQIGRPITSPAIINTKIATHDGVPTDEFRQDVENILADQLAQMPKLVDDFVAGAIDVF